jgi:hypothetical protein
MSSPEFKAASGVVVRFGKYKGKAIDKISETDDGLKYLDWLNGQEWLTDPLKTHVVNYLSDPTIKQELAKIT